MPALLYYSCRLSRSDGYHKNSLYGACSIKAARCGCSSLGFTFECGLVHAIIARETFHQRAVNPIVEDPADIFSRNAGHGSEITLRDFLLNQNVPLANFLAERLGKVQ